MKTSFTKTFKKNYLKRIQPFKNLDKQLEERYNLFVKDLSNSIWPYLDKVIKTAPTDIKKAPQKQGG